MEPNVLGGGEKEKGIYRKHINNWIHLCVTFQDNKHIISGASSRWRVFSADSHSEARKAWSVFFCRRCPAPGGTKRLFSGWIKWTIAKLSSSYWTTALWNAAAWRRLVPSHQIRRTHAGENFVSVTAARFPERDRGWRQMASIQAVPRPKTI